MSRSARLARSLATSAALIILFALVVMIYHRLGLIGWYGGKINGGVWFGPADHFVGLELWGHFGVFHDVNW